MSHAAMASFATLKSTGRFCWICLSFAKNEGFGLRGLIKSPLLGPKGNAEFLVWLDFDPLGSSAEELVAGVIKEEN